MADGEGNSAAERVSARALLYDGADRILLIRFQVTRNGAPFSFWAAPGGGVEAGESVDEAIRRELREELGADILVAGPVQTVFSEFEHEGRHIDNIDCFFVGRCDPAAVRLASATEAERTAMREMKWWPLEDIAASAETFFPDELAVLAWRLSGFLPADRNGP